MFKSIFIIAILLSVSIIQAPPAFSQDSAWTSELRASLNHKFILDFLERERPQTRFDCWQDLAASRDCYRITKSEDTNAIESFLYIFGYKLYDIQPTDNLDHLYVLTLDYFGLSELYLLSNHNGQTILLDKLEINERSHSKFGKLTFNRRNFLTLIGSYPGTSYLDEQYSILGVINNKFQTLFTTSLLLASDWTMPTGNPKDEFIRTTRTLDFRDANMDGFSDISLDAQEDLINMGGQVKSFDFRNGRLVKHRRHWKEVYLWNDKAFTFTLEKSRTTIPLGN